ncbi:MAG TPA: SIMPL domain-containing protein [Alphaproteobacteria bacterium]|nr:SIMPL domain-containing protein [Alphaproteobacteria bacterium]
MKNDSTNGLTLIIAIIFAAAFVIGLASVSLEKKSDYITVGGEAQALVEPDSAIIYVNINTLMPTAEEAQQENSRIVEDLKNSLSRSGITNVETNYYYLNEQLDWTSEGSVSKGFQVTNGIKIYSDVSKISDTIRIATENGVNSIGSIELQTSRDAENKAVAEAMRKATLNAKEKADTVLSSVGRKTGRVLKIEESGWHITTGTDSELLSSIPAEYQDGSVSLQRLAVQANVNVVFKIR